MRGKLGQFYLIAAIIIVIALVGVVAVTNFAITRESADDIKLYQLSKDLELEGEQVINFGILNDKDIRLGEDSILRQFTGDYGSYISNQETDVYFIFGDKTGITVSGYTEESMGGVGLDFGGGPVTINVVGDVVQAKDYDFDDPIKLAELFGCTNSGGNDPNSCDNLVQNNELTKTDVIVEVGGIKYPFEMKEGENFFFVIQQERNRRITQDV